MKRQTYNILIGVVVVAIVALLWSHISTSLLVLAALVSFVVWAVRRPRQGSAALYCSNCGIVGTPKKRVKGSFWVEVLLWLCFVVPGMIYSVWRLTTQDVVCPSCGAPNMIPVDSPKARAAFVATPPAAPTHVA